MVKLLNVYLVAVAITCLTGLPVTATAQDQYPLECTLRALREQVVFGDSLTIVCSAVVPEGTTILDPVLEGTAITESQQPSWKQTEQNSDGSTVVNYGFLIYAFAPDTLRAGPVHGEAIGPDGTPFSYTSDTILIRVGTVLSEADTIPYPLRSPVSIEAQGIPGWVIIIGILVLLLLVTVLLFYFWKRRTRSFTPSVEPPVDEIGEFLKIAEMALHEKGRLKELYAHVSAAMRAFLHRNMPFDARHETTTEIIRELGRTEYNGEITTEIQSILLEADQVMFAKYVPTWDQSTSIVERALVPVREILDEKRRRIEATLENMTEDTAVNPYVAGNEESVTQPVEHGGGT